MTKEEDFEKWIVKEVGIQDAPIFSKGSQVRKVAIAFAAHQSQLKPQEGERVLNLCNDIGCDGHVVLRKTCEKCGRSVAHNPLKQ